MTKYMDTGASLRHGTWLEINDSVEYVEFNGKLEIDTPVYAHAEVVTCLDPANVVKLIKELTGIAVKHGWMPEPGAELTGKLATIYDQANQGLDHGGRNEQDVLADVLASISLIATVGR